MHRLTQLLIFILVSLSQSQDSSVLCKTVAAIDCRHWPTNVNCGSDGRTYDNSCLFVQAHCQNFYLHLKYPGRCRPYLNMVPHPTGVANNIILSLVCLDILALDCKNVISTVKICGSDGRTYWNNCHFEKSRCRNHNLQMKTIGSCT